jgi:glycosyltransferase A (GT-A) superfamily protein (DUF2064 family)
MTALAAQLIVLAKAPVPGRVKTRLTPPFTPHEAAALAESALADTLEAGASASFARHVLALADQWAAAGTLRAELPGRFEVTAQRGGGLDERIAAAFDDAYATAPVPAVLIGMDTPQVTPALLLDGLRALDAAPSSLGLSTDGGYWGIGFAVPDAGALVGVPMSAGDTGAAQHARLLQRGLDPARLPSLTDVDDIATARLVAGQIPGSRFAAALGDIELGRAAA